MSNTGVGSVYQTIINEVINSSRVDFEENGIEESALEELRKVSLEHAQALALECNTTGQSLPDIACLAVLALPP